jgi:hypothetical protein
MKARNNYLNKKEPVMETVEVFHTQDEELRDYSWTKASAKVIEIAAHQEKLSQVEMDEPHEFNGFGD